jgi:predicted transglutaminase-like cysteine proteinase
MDTAWSEWTGQHAVLILRLDAGDYVLDNTTPHILNVSQTSYQWQAIQTGSSLLEWSSIIDAETRLAGYTAG